MLGHELGQAHEHAAALGRVGVGPVAALEGTAGGGDGPVDVLGAAAGDLGDLAAIAR